MTIQSKLKKIEDEFEKRFSPEWWYGFGRNADINRKGIEGIKSFFRSHLLKFAKEYALEVIGEDEPLSYGTYTIPKKYTTSTRRLLMDYPYEDAAERNARNYLRREMREKVKEG